MKRSLEIMDTTLRDGEQTSGVSYSPKEKLTIAKLLLDELKIDRIEVASARVSEGELNSVKQITSWAKKNKKIESIEVLTFLDDGKSIKWLLDSGCSVQNLLTKGSFNHLKHQLKRLLQIILKISWKQLKGLRKTQFIQMFILKIGVME